MDTDKDGISVIVPVYNTEDYLKKCIKSITKQTFKNLEIICVLDNNSYDGSEKILNNLAKEDKRIKIINASKSENIGAGHNRNIGIDAATKNYIGFVDADDFIEYDYYERLYDAMQMFNADIALSNSIEISTEENKVIAEHFYNFQIEYTVAKMFRMMKTGSVWDKLFRTDLIKNNNIKFLENVLYEDVPFNLACFLKANKMVTAPGSLYYWQRHRFSVTLSAQYKEKRLNDSYTVSKYIIDYVKTHKEMPKQDADYVVNWTLNSFGRIAMKVPKYQEQLIKYAKGFI